MKTTLYQRILLAVCSISCLVGSAYSQSTNITVGGTSRNMIVHAPTGIATNRPLLISMHGMQQDAAYQQSTTGWDAVADTAKFVVVYPNGLNKSWDISGMTDMNFVTAIIDAMYTKYGIDKNRVYMTGFSMGGMVTYHAMNKIADKIAAFGPVSGYMNAVFTSSRPVPLIHVHGTDDPVVPCAPGNSGSTGAYFVGCEAMTVGWAKRNNCSTTPTTTTPYPVGTSNTNFKKVWKGGDCGTEVVLINITGKGHWHSNDPAGVYTTKEQWAFLRRFTLSCGTSASVAITSPTITSFVSPAAISLAATASISSGTITKVEFFSGTKLLGAATASPYTYSWANVAAGTYSVTAVATDNSGKTATSEAVIIKVNPAQAAYSGTAAVIPGKIEFENYDIGGNGFAYLDNAADNTGGASFRTDEDVDIENCTDIGTGYNIGFATKGEWLEYTVSVAQAGKYDLTLRAACSGDGRTLSVAAKDVVVAKDVAIPNTADWQTWTDVVVKDIALEAGVQVIRVTVGATDYVNLNYMTFAAENVTVAKIQLKPGWNLIGCPLAGSNDLADALSSIWANVQSVKNMDSFYDKSQAATFNTLSKVNWGIGYWVKVDKACELTWK